MCERGKPALVCQESFSRCKESSKRPRKFLDKLRKEGRTVRTPWGDRPHPLGGPSAFNHVKATRTLKFLSRLGSKGAERPPFIFFAQHRNLVFSVPNQTTGSGPSALGGRTVCHYLFLRNTEPQPFCPELRSQGRTVRPCSQFKLFQT